MIKRVMALALCSVALVLPARASTSNEVRYERSASANWYDSTTGQYGNVSVWALTHEESADATFTRTDEYFANATLGDQSPCCSNTYYPTTAVPASALTLDPVGNTAHIQVTLGLPQLLVIDLTLTRPGFTQVAQGNPQPNAWADPNDPGARADVANVGLFLTRYNYVIKGSVNGIPLTPTTTGSGFTAQSLYQTDVAAQLP